MAHEEPLATLSSLCLSYPESSAQPTGTHVTFRVRKKVFAYLLDNHHGDGIVSVCTKTQLGEHEELARREPKKFYIPAYIGPSGWVGLRLDRGAIDWDEVAELVAASYDIAAPKKLAALARSARARR